MPGHEVILPSEAISTDPEGRSLLRAIKAHEFSMTGGIPVGEREGKVTYSDPISETDPQWSILCPWHDGDCTAWNEIVAGRGYWTRMQRELAELREEVANPGPGVGEETDQEIIDRDLAVAHDIENLETALQWRPRDAKALRDRTPEMIAEERARADLKKAKAKRDLAAATANAAKVAAGLQQAPNWTLRRADGSSDPSTVLCPEHYADTATLNAAITEAGDDTDWTEWSRTPRGRSECVECARIERRIGQGMAPVKQTGNPWDRHPEGDGETQAWQPKTYAPKNYPHYTPPKEDDARDDAFLAFAGAETPDTIEIDGDEDDEE